MSPKPFIVTPGDRGAALNVVGTKVIVLASEADAQDQQITLQSGPEGMGPPAHSHDWDESFYVTRGQVRFVCGDETSMCTEGTFVHVPAGTVHAFSYGPGGGEMLEITGRRSKAVGLFTALNREIPPDSRDVTRVVEVLGEYGVNVRP